MIDMSSYCLYYPKLCGFYRSYSQLPYLPYNESLELPERYTETPESNDIEHYGSGYSSNNNTINLFDSLSENTDLTVVNDSSLLNNFDEIKYH